MATYTTCRDEELLSLFRIEYYETERGDGGGGGGGVKRREGSSPASMGIFRCGNGGGRRGGQWGGGLRL